MPSSYLGRIQAVITTILFSVAAVKCWALITPARRGKGKKAKAAQQQPDQTPAERRASMTWPFSHIRVLHGTGTS